MDKKAVIKLKQGVRYENIVSTLKGIGFSIFKHNEKTREVEGMIYFTKYSSLKNLPFVESVSETIASVQLPKPPIPLSNVPPINGSGVPPWIPKTF
jgi:hypothetical protein